MPRQSQHFEQLNRFVVDVGEHDNRAAFFRDVYDAEQDGDADAIHQLGVAEIDHERAAAGIKLLFAFAFNSFTGKFVQIVGRIYNARSADSVSAHVGL